MCFLDKNGSLNPVHPPKWQVTDPKRVLAPHGHQRNPCIASSGVRSILFIRSFWENSRILFIRTNFPPNSVIKIRIIFFIMFSALLNHIKLLRTDIRLLVGTICVFMTFFKAVFNPVAPRPEYCVRMRRMQLPFSQAIIGHCMSASA